MKKEHVKHLITVFLITIASVFFACQRGDDDKDVEKLKSNPSWEGSPEECDHDHSPDLVEVKLLINGVETDMPVTVLTTDEIQLAIEYSDGECNLEGGTVVIYADPEDPKHYELDQLIEHFYTIENIGCSSEEEGHPYYQSIDPLDYLLPEGLVRALPMLLRLFDNCMYTIGSYNILPLDFTVVKETI